MNIFLQYLRVALVRAILRFVTVDGWDLGLIRIVTKGRPQPYFSRICIRRSLLRLGSPDRHHKLGTGQEICQVSWYLGQTRRTQIWLQSRSYSILCIDAIFSETCCFQSQGQLSFLLLHKWLMLQGSLETCLESYGFPSKFSFVLQALKNELAISLAAQLCDPVQD